MNPNTLFLTYHGQGQSDNPRTDKKHSPWTLKPGKLHTDMKWERAVWSSKEMMHVNMTHKIGPNINYVSRIMASSAFSLKADVCAHFMAK